MPIRAIRSPSNPVTNETHIKRTTTNNVIMQQYEVGPFRSLENRSVPRDGLDIHHVMQKHPAGDVVGGHDKLTAPAIAIPRAEHSQIPTIKVDYNGTARQLLAIDINNLRNYTNAPNSQLRELIDLNLRMFPDAFRK